jgi:hypothetical protein
VLESKKRFWKMDGFVPISTDPEDSAGDLPASVFVFGGNNPPPEDGIYFINARIVTTVTQDETSLELYSVDVSMTSSIRDGSMNDCSWGAADSVRLIGQKGPTGG